MNSFRIFAVSMGNEKYISVILPLKLEWEPCYRLPYDVDEAWIGDRVKVRFSNKEYSAVISAVDIIPETDRKKIKPITAMEEGISRILPEEMELWRSVADYYLCSVGEVYKAAYPYTQINLEEARAASLQKVSERKEKLAESVRERITRLQARLEKKKEQIARARKESTRLAYTEDLKKAENELKMAKSALSEIICHTVEDKRSDKALRFDSVILSEAQTIAYSTIKEGFAMKKPVLLHGVPGSGKTEIYTKLAQETLNNGRNVLYLVPEIALSRQLQERLRAHFGDHLLTFHSGESSASRRNTTEAVRETAVSGSNYIVIGTRSSLFLPHHHLGLIIVDEEHDNSYKQDSPAPRYNGRDTALMLHQLQKCNIILGSATPSLEEIYNCRTGKHIMVELRKRFHGSDEPDIKIIDTKAERKKNGMRGNFSRKLIDHIDKTLSRGKQVMILRSRRAWASVLQCENCGEITRCPHCNVSLNLHKNGRMICHYCGYTSAYTGICAGCGGELKSLGAGTQRIEEEAAELFPEARIARLDSDTAQNKKSEAGIICDFGKGEIDILIGTQMVTKGFDFSNLSLVAIVAADSLLGIQDFRADEKALQILEQFKGRCGRRGDKGLFVIQTSQPEHPVYQRILRNEPEAFNNDLFQERKDFGFPPFTRIVEINFKDAYEDRAQRMAERLGTELRKHFNQKDRMATGDPVTGPYSPVVDKVADHHIRIIRISLKKDRSLMKHKEALREIIHRFEKENRYDGHIFLNVDPS